MRVLVAIMLSTSIALHPMATRAEDGPLPPSHKPYGRCELLLMKTLDGFREFQRGTIQKIDQIVTPVHPWNISQQDEETITNVFSDASLSEEQRFERAYSLLVGARIKQLNSVSRFFSRGAVEDSLKQNSIYSKTIGALVLKYYGPHYNPIFNRTATYVRPSAGITPLDSIMAVHETEHLLHRNTNPIFWMAAIKVAAFETLSLFIRTPILVAIRRRQEVRAIGAQWELARLIPAEVRKKLLQDWRYEKSHISHVERLWVRALIKSGILQRAISILERGLNLEAAGLKSNSSRLGLEETLVARIVSGRNLTNWYSPFAARARDRIDTTELAYIEGIWREGIEFEPLKAEMDSYLGSHSETEILNDNGIEQTQIRHLQGLVSDLRYDSKFSDALDQIYGATLENAGLSKDQFIERLSAIHGYTMENIKYRHYTTPARTYILFVSYATVLFSMAGLVSSSAIPSPDVHAIVSYLLYLFGK